MVTLPRTAGLLLLLSGCEEDVPASTQIESLQIVSMVSEPMEVQPHERTTLTVTIADPAGSGAEVAVWMCTPIGDGRTCLEAQAATDAQPVHVGVRDAQTHGAAFEVVPLDVDVAEIEAILDDGREFRGVLAFALACAPGLCPLFDDLEAGAVDPAVLADPDLLLEGLPMEGVSLAWKTMTLTGAHYDDREVNPELMALFTAPVEVAAGQEVDLPFATAGTVNDGALFPLATTGGFAEPYVYTDVPTPTVTYVAPAEGSPREGTIYAVLDNARGGQAVWFGPVRVR